MNVKEHYPGYRIEEVGDAKFVYCPRHPEVKHGGTLENALKAYDIHYEIAHLKTEGYSWLK